MRKILYILLFAVALVALDEAAGAAESRIGYVDIQQALSSSDAGKEAKEVFKGEVERLQKELNRQQEEMKKMKDELENQAFLLSNETKGKKEKEYQEKVKNFQRFYQDSQEGLEEKDKQLTRKIIIDLREVIVKLGQDEGYMMILEKNDSNILYAQKAIDLTAEVVRRYNELRKKP